MKKLLLILLCLPFIGFGQGWSSYYIDANVNHNINANIYKNVDISGNINKTVTSIDYGALAQANAQREKNRLEREIYANEQQKLIAMEIANNIVKAYDYGQTVDWHIKTWKSKQKPFKELTGLNEYRQRFVVPHNSIFVPAGGPAGGMRIENVSEDGITTEILFHPPYYNINNVPIVSWEEYIEWQNKNVDEKEMIKIPKPKKSDYKTTPLYNKAMKEYRNSNKSIELVPALNLEDAAKMHDLTVGKLNEGADGDIFVQQKEVKRATIYGVKGFKGTLIWEDEYQLTITDNFSSRSNLGNGMTNFVKVRTYGDKGEVTFEQLEGRRYYLKRLIEKVISTAVIDNVKY